MAVDRAAILDLRVAELAVALGDLLERVDELSPTARDALLAVCGDVAAVLERRKLQGGNR